MPTLVPLADGLIVGDQTISSIALRALAIDGEQNIKDVILIDAMQSGYPGVLRLVESLAGVPYADLDRMTARDFDVTALAVLAHLKAYDDHLKKAILNYGRPNVLIRP